MNYELAKKLKEAEFPQGGLEKLRVGNSSYRCPQGGYLLDENGICPDCKKQIVRDVYVSYPTLSELIEACGDRFNFLGNDLARKNYVIGEGTMILKIGEGNTQRICWRASGFKHNDKLAWPEELVGAEGDTPEEAVAELWLKLNKKNGNS